MATAPAPPAPTSNPLVRLGIFLAVCLGVGYLAWPPGEKITLGLDLQGGTHMVLEVDLDEAVKSSGERTLGQIRTQLEEKGITGFRSEQDRPGRLSLSGIPEGREAEAREVIDLHQASWTSTWTGTDVTLELRSQAEQDMRNGAANQVRETIARRINEFGVREPQVTASGTRGERIIVQLPGLDDVDRVKRIITKSSVMDFRLGHGEAASPEQLTAQLGGTLPDNMTIIPGAPGTRQAGRFYAVERVAVIRGEDLIDARQSGNEFGQPVIAFTLSPEAGRIFGDFTGQHVRDPLAVVLDGQVVQYATIQSQIFSNGQISGARSVQEANDDALTLRSGALPAKVSILFEQTVGPSLGQDSIEAGLKASLIGFTLVVLFMLLFYKGAGLNAIFALALNMVLSMGLLAAAGATLTLPGIAGLVLTMGMAVDANVVIFERIKEELALGKSPRASVAAGFDKAFTAIFDSNITTIIACFFLYNFGSGPIKGFAVTLTLGLVCSMFTAIWVSRAIFEAGFELGLHRNGLSIQWFTIRVPRIPFMKLAPTMGTISLGTVVAAVVIVVTLGLKPGIDFAGGTQVVVQSREQISAEDIRGKLAGTEFAEIIIQEYGKPEDRQFLLRVLEAESAVATTAVNAGDAAEEAETEAAATRLVGHLESGEPAPGINLNSAGRDALETALRSAGLGGEAAKASAEAILKTRAKLGTFADAAAAAAVPGVDPVAAEWLRSNAHAGAFAVLNVVSVGPAVGAELAQQALKAVLWSLVGILCYMWFRFELRFGAAAVLAVAHDVQLTIGIVALLGIEFDISVIAALLTLVGYSINDTIILFDRVRENMGTQKGASLRDVLNLSVNQTLSRTILTSTTVFLACLSLLLFGGEVLHGFSLVMTIGVVVGTYSTTFVAAPLVLAWDWARNRRARVASPEAA